MESGATPNVVEEIKREKNQKRKLPRRKTTGPIKSHDFRILKGTRVASFRSFSWEWTHCNQSQQDPACLACKHLDSVRS